MFDSLALSWRRLGILPFENRNDIGVWPTIWERTQLVDFAKILINPLINHSIVAGPEGSYPVLGHCTVRKKNVPYVICSNFSFEILLLLGIQYSRQQRIPARRRLHSGKNIKTGRFWQYQNVFSIPGVRFHERDDLRENDRDIRPRIERPKFIRQWSWKTRRVREKRKEIQQSCRAQHAPCKQIAAPWLE